MNRENRLPTTLVGWLHNDASIEATGSQQRRVQYIRPIGSGEHDHRVTGAESVHFGQDLIERLLLLGIRAETGRAAARAADRVQLVYEDDRRRRVASLLEQIAHATGSNADDQLHEFAGSDAEEGDVRFTRHGASQHCLASAGWANQQRSLWNHTSQARVLAWLAEEVDDFCQFLFGLVDTRDIVERDLSFFVGGSVITRCAATTNAEQAASSAELTLSTARKPQESADQQDRWTEAEQRILPPRCRLVQQRCVHHNCSLLQLRQEVGIGKHRLHRRECGNLRRLA
jgi:hypothetical protein